LAETSFLELKGKSGKRAARQLISQSGFPSDPEGAQTTQEKQQEP